MRELWDLLQAMLASARWVSPKLCILTIIPISDAIDSVVENIFGGSRSSALKVNSSSKEEEIWPFVLI